MMTSVLLIKKKTIKIYVELKKCPDSLHFTVNSRIFKNKGSCDFDFKCERDVFDREPPLQREADDTSAQSKR